MRRHNHDVGSRVVKGQPAFGEAGGVTLAQGAQYIVAAVAVPVAWFEPAPFDVRREDRLERVEVPAAPGVESLLCKGQAGAIAHHPPPYVLSSKSRLILVAAQQRHEAPLEP